MVAFALPSIVGSDIESAVHIGRLVFPILAFATVVFLADAYSNPRKNLVFVLGILCVVIVFLATAKNVFDRNQIHIPPIDSVQKVQIYAPLLSYIEEHGQGAVVWAPDELAPYILVHTKAKVLFAQQGGLYSIPSEEQHERYLISRFPNTVSIDSLIRDVGLYDLVAPKSHIEFGLRIRPCSVAGNCDPIQTYAAYQGEQYFQSMKDRYEGDVKPHISEYLDMYQVRFIVMPSGTELDPKIHAEKVYTDPQYSLYERN
jgi:hypothetical protein